MLYVGNEITSKSKRGRVLLPDDFITRTAAAIARKGAGKTYTSKVLAEELLEAGHQVVVIDPLDVWWGLGVGTGSREGHHICVFGGEHADVPLAETGGSTLAQYLAERPEVNAIICIDHLSKNGQRRFATDFFEAFFRAKTKHEFRTPVHLFVDEADMFAPQRVMKGSERMLGALDTIVRRGRTRGIGVTMITQRPATLHKDLLTQVDLLIAMQLISPQDRKAIDAWVKHCAAEDECDEVMRSLPKLKVGQAWFWAPAWLHMLQLVEIRKLKTYDSSSTPDSKTRKREKVHKATVNVEQIRSDLGSMVQEVEAADPGRLKRRIDELERANRQLQQELAARNKLDEAEIARRVEVLADDVAHEVAAGLNARWRERIRRMRATVIGAFDTSPEHLPKDDGSTRLQIEQAIQQDEPPAAEPEHIPAAEPPATPRQEYEPHPTRKHRARALEERTAVGPGKDLPKGVRAVLSVLARHGECNMGKLALLAGYSPKSSTMRNILSSCRNAEEGPYIDGSGKGPFTLTKAGDEALGTVDPLPSGKERIQWWADKLGTGVPRRVFDVLVRIYPADYSRDAIAEAAGCSANSSTLRNAFSKLRTMGLMEGSGDALRASSDLF